MAAPPRALDALRAHGGASSPTWELPPSRPDSRASAASAPVGASAPRFRGSAAAAAAPSQQQQQQQDDGGGGSGLEARWRAALQREQEVHRELEAERAARQEAELVLADTTQARPARARRTRACVGCSAGGRV
jgi:hypothetical protein